MEKILTKEDWISLQGERNWPKLHILLDNADKYDIIPERTLRVACDTRDFSLYLGFEPAHLDEDRGIVTLIKNPNLIKEDFCIERKEIIPWLLKLQEWSGGIGDFRHLVISEPTVMATGWELKYIRFYIHPTNPNVYIVCNRNSKAIRWKNIKQSSIIQKEIGFIENMQIFNEQIAADLKEIQEKKE